MISCSNDGQNRGRGREGVLKGCGYVISCSNNVDIMKERRGRFERMYLCDIMPK